MDLVKTGVAGLDEILGGGIPRGHAVAVLGPFGTGKTTLGLQFLWEGLRSGEKGIFISLEEDPQSIVETAQGFGWALGPHLDAKVLGLVKLEPADAKMTIGRIKGELPTFLRGFGAQRVVIDSVSLLNMMFGDDAERGAHLFNLCRQVKESGATSILTAEAREGNPRASRDGLTEYVADGVVSLQYDVRDGREVQLTLQVVKMRRMKHSRTVKPYSFGEQGITVHTGAEVF